MSAISHRIARSLSASTLTSSDVADRCRLGLDPAALGGEGGALGFEACQGAGLPVPLIREPRTAPALAFHVKLNSVNAHTNASARSGEKPISSQRAGRPQVVHGREQE